jgi:hypothetical protein
MGNWQYTDSFAKVRAAKALGMKVVFAGQVWKIWVPTETFRSFV